MVNSKGNSEDRSGTPPYTAPEILEGNSHSFSCDLYSLGVTLYEMVFGTRPLKGKTKRDILREINKVKQIRLTEIDLGSNWSEAFGDFINSVLK